MTFRRIRITIKTLFVYRSLGPNLNIAAQTGLVGKGSRYPDMIIRRRHSQFNFLVTVNIAVKIGWCKFFGLSTRQFMSANTIVYLSKDVALLLVRRKVARETYCSTSPLLSLAVLMSDFSKLIHPIYQWMIFMNDFALRLALLGKSQYSMLEKRQKRLWLSISKHPIELYVFPCGNVTNIDSSLGDKGRVHFLEEGDLWRDCCKTSSR